MAEYICTNERYSNEPVLTTLRDLEELSNREGWSATFREQVRYGEEVIVDQHGEIVAVERGAWERQRR